MTELKGKYNSAKVFTDNIEQSSVQQIEHLLDQEFISGSKIRIMPDVHAGMGCPIGTTMTIADKVVPNLVGLDIGCGMETVLLKDKRVNLQQLDKLVHKYIPAGMGVRKDPHHMADEIDLNMLRCAKHVDLQRATLSIGTLGGGNHFIELGVDEDEMKYLVVHSGSRNLGKQVCEYYQNIAADSLGRKGKGADRVLAYLEGEPLKDYLHDMAIVQDYADLNRRTIVKEIVKQKKLKTIDSFTTVHNYIDLDSMILRKGAVSAQDGERVLIPMNMRDGSLICVGKGNADWNYSAPHGAGRLMNRSDVKHNFTVHQFKEAMEGIYSTTIKAGTLDEAPFVYKSMGEIVANIGETVDILKTVKPLYSFKAVE
ncbi:MAG: RtcB family protein [Defluviitaleaceae bacterium]|nr:RtcB family protein [Defluviitaleaceae bacterium]